MSDYAITMVFDPNFGEKLLELAKKECVWIVSSPSNDAAVDLYCEWTKGEECTDPLISGVTVFQQIQISRDLLDSVFEHHGEFAHDPPMSKLRIIGLELEDSLSEMLREYGFTIKKDGSMGLLAKPS